MNNDALYNVIQAIIAPLAKDIYSWSHTPLGRIRVVIIGQDPYHASGRLSFVYAAVIIANLRIFL